jgi:hypothetical protein
MKQSLVPLRQGPRNEIKAHVLQPRKREAPLQKLGMLRLLYSALAFALCWIYGTGFVGFFTLAVQ